MAIQPYVLLRTRSKTHVIAELNMILKKTRMEASCSKELDQKNHCFHTCNCSSRHELDPYFPIQEKSYLVVHRVTISAKKQPDWHQVPHLTQSYEKPFIFTVEVLLQKTRDPQVTHALIFRRKHSATLPAQKLSTLNTLAKEKTFLSTSLSSAQLILQAEELKLHLLTKWPVYPILQAGSFFLLLLFFFQIQAKDGRLFWQTYRR